jgi:hypothetical protein
MYLTFRWFDYVEIFLTLWLHSIFAPYSPLFIRKFEKEKVPVLKHHAMKLKVHTVLISALDGGVLATILVGQGSQCLLDRSLCVPQCQFGCGGKEKILFSCQKPTPVLQIIVN